MTSSSVAVPRLVVSGILAALLAGCAAPVTRDAPAAFPEAVESEVHVSTKHAVNEAQARRSRGERVWCVPFARTASGVQIRGNAETWWAAAKGLYQRGSDPSIGSVVVFTGTKKLPMGHVAVVSSVRSDREILIDHANWKRNQVSLGMSVIDVSQAGDWSAVRVESNPGAYGRVYPVSGFIYPQSVAPAENPTVVVSTSGRG